MDLKYIKVWGAKEKDQENTWDNKEQKCTLEKKTVCNRQMNGFWYGHNPIMININRWYLKQRSPAKTILHDWDRVVNKITNWIRDKYIEYHFFCLVYSFVIAKKR